MRVLVVAAHMDDEVLGVGGTMAKHARQGDEVHVAIACHRVYDHRFDAETNAQERAATLAAVTVLGCKDVHFLGLRDELLDERLQDVIVPLEALLSRLEPEVAYVTHRGDVNQDHRAVFQATLVACRSFARPKVRRLLAYETLSSTEQAPPFPEYAFQPNVFVNIADSLATKLEAMRQYQRELREFPHPRSLRGIDIQARMRGMQAGYDAAEAFALVRDHWD